MALFKAFRRDSVDVTLTQNHERLSAHLDLVEFLAVEENVISLLYCPNVGSGGANLSPCETFTHLSGGGYEDSPTASAFLGISIEFHEHTVIEHPHRQPVRMRDRWRFGLSGLDISR